MTSQQMCWSCPDRTPAHVEVPEVAGKVPDRGYAASTRQWVLDPVADGRHTRVIVRQR